MPPLGVENPFNRVYTESFARSTKMTMGDCIEEKAVFYMSAVSQKEPASISKMWRAKEREEMV